MSASTHLVRGDDESLVGAAVTELVHRLVGDADRSLVVAELDGDDYELAAVVDAAQTPPFLTERRVVVARGLGRFAAGDVGPLVGYLARPLDTTDLVLSVTGGRLPKALLDAVKKAGGIVVDTNVGTGRKDRAAFVDEQVAGSGLKLDEPARRAVTDHLGEDLGRLASLLGTLGAAFGPGAKLGLADVEPFLGAAGSVPPWDLTDAIDRGDTARALDALRRMTVAGGRHPLQIMAVLHGHYGRILRLEGGPAHDRTAAAALLGGRTSPFQADKALQQAKRLGHAGVTRAIHLLADADLDLRGAKDWPEDLVMEVLVARLSRLAPSSPRR